MLMLADRRLAELDVKCVERDIRSGTDSVLFAPDLGLPGLDLACDVTSSLSGTEPVLVLVKIGVMGLDSGLALIGVCDLPEASDSVDLDSCLLSDTLMKRSESCCIFVFMLSFALLLYWRL